MRRRSFVLGGGVLGFNWSFASPARAQSELETRAATLRKRHADEGFTVLVEPPFVVIGDEKRRTVEARAIGTVRWAVERLRTAYFDRDPAEVIEIWLFGSDASYRKYAKVLFDDEPDTPYGYYSPSHAALVMNISTGGGTLVHEIVHPFIATNFPTCPAWFNEGLASLYEQCDDLDGAIRGLPNWRLEGLQAALRSGTVPSFARLMSASREAFYERDPGSHYAQSRYLCFYLQEKGLLSRFYREFVAATEDDPTGYRTLREVLGRPDMRAWQKRWAAFVLDLRYP